MIETTRKIPLHVFVALYSKAEPELPKSRLILVNKNSVRFNPRPSLRK